MSDSPVLQDVSSRDEELPHSDPHHPVDETPDPFEGVPDSLRETMKRQGFQGLTAVQRAVLGDELVGKDLRISSQTGSGKTVALGLVLARSLGAKSRDSRAPSAVVITPTRELAAQVQKELGWLFSHLDDAAVEVVTGGTSVSMERKRLQRSPRVVVGTPGRLLDHMRSGALDVGYVSELVLDEADQMLDMGFRDELEGILEKMPDGRRTHLVSATFAPEVRKLADRYQSAPVSVQGTRLGQANQDIEHVACLVPYQRRYDALVNWLLTADAETEVGEEIRRTLVFVRTRIDATEVAERLARDGFGALSLSGDLAQAQRTRTLEAFRDGRMRILVATDVAARGIDVPDVGLVVHLDAPTDGDVYTHRSGRTGRAGRQGRSLMLVPPQARRRIQRLLEQARVKVDWRDVPSADKVRKAFVKRSRRALHDALADETGPDESHLEYASRLLENHEATKVVAMLLAERGLDMPAEPRVLDAPMARRDDRGARDRGPVGGASRDRHANHLHRDDAHRPGLSPRGMGTRGAAPGRRDEGFVRFFVNYGFRQGAAPNRLLALVCRRGGIDGGSVGAIDIFDGGAHFDVAADVAAEFEHAARRPDARDPRIFIERFRGEHAGAAGRRIAGKPRAGAQAAKFNGAARDDERPPGRAPRGPSVGHGPGPDRGKPRARHAGIKKPFSRS